MSEQTEYLSDLIDMSEVEGTLEEAFDIDAKEAQASMVEWFKELIKRYDKEN